MITRLALIVGLLGLTSCGIDPAAALFDSVDQVSNYGSGDESDDGQNPENADAVRRGTIVGNGNQPKGPHSDEIPPHSSQPQYGNSEPGGASQSYDRNESSYAQYMVSLKVEGVDSKGMLTEKNILSFEWKASEGVACSLIRKTGLLYFRSEVVATSTKDDRSGSYSKKQRLDSFKIQLRCSRNGKSVLVYDSVIRKYTEKDAD